ncbi:hypothetical protein [Romboutsia timonensis]|uniref:hypothetical protein n=1 Tax=Romboutsia timonensis TaxID=1776391 RepID=UPI0012B6015B|nr:hypothetical protein [Romboutsia timonensis]
MKKVKIEDMKVEIRYTNKMVDKDKLYDIFTGIIKRIETEEKKEGGVYEKKDSCAN